MRALLPGGGVVVADSPLVLARPEVRRMVADAVELGDRAAWCLTAAPLGGLPKPRPPRK